MYYMGMQIPQGKRQFLETIRPTEKAWRVFSAEGLLHCKMDHSIHRVGSLLVDVTLNFARREKFAPAMRSFV